MYILDGIINNRIIRDICPFLDQEDDDYHFKPKRISNFLNNNYIKYESNGDRNKNLLLYKYLNKSESYRGIKYSIFKIWYMKNSGNNSN